MRNRCTNHLAKAKVRQSWSKYNLYNLSRLRTPRAATRTFFQQKWSAKSLARAYHGEQVREGQWEKMFSRRLRAVVPMSHRYLAANDGSDESAGRGSGLEKVQKDPNWKPGNAPTPYMQMTFAPLERRLDVAIFRALFASSTRQARQFVVHGSVTVNGKKMKYPGYLLNPGDMFQVNPERVMYATGALKDGKERRTGRIRRQIKAKTEAETEASAGEEKNEKGSTEGEAEAAKSEEAPKDNRQTLKQLLSQAKGIMTSNKSTLPAQKKRDLRSFQSVVRRVLSRSSSSTVLTDNLEAQFLELQAVLKESAKAKQAQSDSASDGASMKAKDENTSPTDPSVAGLTKKFKETSIESNQEVDELDTSDFTPDDFSALRVALQELHENPIDSTKPYATPWRPRPYMSAFAFIPRYLEVNQNICAAVYLRHPVARPKMGEVPTPFGEKISAPAFAWYLRRR